MLHQQHLYIATHDLFVDDVDTQYDGNYHIMSLTYAIMDDHEW